MAHPEAKLIPESMWGDDDLFRETLPDFFLSLMDAKNNEQLPSLLINTIPKLTNYRLEKIAWLSIAVSHPGLEFQRLMEIADKLSILDSDRFQLLAALGKLPYLKKLMAKRTPDAVQAMIKAYNFSAYRNAAKEGHLKVLKYLETNARDSVKAMIEADGLSAYRYAASNGHLKVLEHLEEEASDSIQAMIKSDVLDFCAYNNAALNGHLEVLKHLEKINSGSIQAMIEPLNFFAYQNAAYRGHLEVCQHMFSKSNACFAYAEMHVEEYGERIVNPFIQLRLLALHQDALNTPANAVFDITDAEQAKICFFTIRNLIRRNDRAFDDEIRFLLTIPAVLRLAELHDHYEGEAEGQLDLAALARDRGSSMTALSVGELKRLDRLRKKYEPMLKKAGASHIIDALRRQLIDRYNKKPSTFTFKGKKTTLPMGFDEFNALNLNDKQRRLALEAYYQHKDHTAWRYLSKPNPWMNPNARYVEQNDDGQYATFEEYQPLIALLYLAAIDTTIDPTDKHTIETRLEHFIDELALINRAHNWDRTRDNPTTGKPEEYDDLTGDRPSCFSGVKRRLFQSLLGHPLMTILTADILLDEVRNFANTYFKTIVTRDNIAQIIKAYNDNILSEPPECLKPLACLNIPLEERQAFELYLAQKYGESYTQDVSLRRVVTNRLSLNTDSPSQTDHYHALKLESLVGFHQQLVNLSAQPISNPASGGFFAGNWGDGEKVSSNKSHDCKGV